MGLIRQLIMIDHRNRSQGSRGRHKALRSLPVGLGCPPELHVRRGHSGHPPGRVCAQALPCEGARDPVFEIITFEMILFQVYGSPDIPVDRVLDLTPD